MRKISRILIIFSILISLVLPIATVSAAGNSGAINLLTQEESKKIEKFIEENMDKGKIPGLAITIVKNDKTIYQKGFGYSNIEANTQVTDKTLFELGSTSKAFTALGILKLEQEGAIKFEDDVSRYIPWFKVKYKGVETNITLEQLLHHSSGIPFKTIDKIPVSEEDNALEETVKTLVNIELDSKPGEKFQYATINYDVLGLIIENVTGLSYEEYMKENIIKPLGLDNTYLFKSEDIVGEVATGYKVGFLKSRSYDAPAYRGNKPAGYIISSVEDMSKWLKIQMGTLEETKFNNILIERSHEANRTITPEPDGSSYAAGWDIYQDMGGRISHGGNNPNYSSFITFKPEKKEGVAVLSNTNSEYVEFICSGVNKILDGNEVTNKNIKDLNKTVDSIAIFIICFVSLVIISTLYFIVKVVKEIVTKERKFNSISLRSIFKIVGSLVFIMGVTYCIYLIPYILGNGISWNFISVWLPNSIKTALYLGCLSVFLSYIYILFTTFFNKKDDKQLLILSLLNIASGFGNALIIFTINISIYSSNNMKLKLLIYFVLGIILYVFGQKIIRQSLVDITNNIVYSKRVEIIKHILKSPYNKFEKIENGRIQSTLNNDTETISRFVNILISGVTSLVTIICCFIYLGFVNKYALVLAVLIVLLIASIYFMAGRYANRIGEEARDLQNIFFRFIDDIIGGFKELSINKNKKHEFQEDMENTCDKYRIKRGKSSLAFANMFVIGELLFTLAIGVIALIFPLILKNLESTSTASYVFILLYMTGPVHGILDTIPNAIEVRISLKRINSLINELSVLNNSDLDSENGGVKDNFKLQLHEVEYEYEKEEGKGFKVGPISHEFRSGEITFITGGNGSGKSTLAKLLAGLYEPTKGYITLDSKKIKQKSLSENYTTIFSDFYLFNKLYGIEWQRKEEEIQKYLEVLQLDKKIKIEDGKFSTTKLSTGQKKRLALLVSYLENKPVYLFDEWAADQDPEFRLFFYNTLLPELKDRGKCVIAITHDDQYFNLADNFIKMSMRDVKIQSKTRI
ncbi:cyclic peptide export ABC transporter [Clostridium botulinum]|uniref:cyclic peptide export ABC transporter n=1 Tax=Clostridium botulinum TaxID=1491 RepID=UPI001400B331|nr:cyclic peptide export ABC transporter [Clostridium botulinum]MBN1040261.1 cyclic peptide export ABC transporter [Clostridium botulinum]MBN1050258.1 cyclic peptide export ABC transporter [Clostridium botulinum]NFI52329.1 cyclic peptide export ABC transporter [Clostridium botulinum]